MKVIVSNPIKHHSHQLILALDKRNYLEKYYTSVWFKQDSVFQMLLYFLPNKVSERLKNELNKRVNYNVDSTKVRTFIWFEFVRKIAKLKGDFWVFLSERVHDRYFHYQLKAERFDIFIGSEKSCLRCFEMAKKMGRITILDLAQVHYSEIDRLRAAYPTLEKGLVSGRRLRCINSVKERELKAADYILTLSEMAKQSLLKAGILPTKIRLLNLGFDPTQFKLKDYKIKTKEFTLLFVGPITKKKGVELICNAIEDINHSDIRLILIGSPSDASDLLVRHRRFIEYYPFKPQTELVKFYQKADVFVFPSFLDSWGMVVLEAMACGTPVIVSENTGAKDVVNRGGGFVIPIDIESLKEKISFLYKNRDQLEVIGRKAHHLSRQYTWGNYHEQVRQTMEEILDKGKQNELQTIKKFNNSSF